MVIGGIIVLRAVCSLKSTECWNGVPCCFFASLAIDVLAKRMVKALKVSVFARALFSAS